MQLPLYTATFKMLMCQALCLMVGTNCAADTCCALGCCNAPEFHGLLLTHATPATATAHAACVPVRPRLVPCSQRAALLRRNQLAAAATPGHQQAAAARALVEWPAGCYGLCTVCGGCKALWRGWTGYDDKHVHRDTDHSADKWRQHGIPAGLVWAGAGARGAAAICTWKGLARW